MTQPLAEAPIGDEEAMPEVTGLGMGPSRLLVSGRERGAVAALVSAVDAVTRVPLHGRRGGGGVN